MKQLIMTKKIFLPLVAALICIPYAVLAQAGTSHDPAVSEELLATQERPGSHDVAQDIASAFRQVGTVEVDGIIVPSVVGVPLQTSYRERTSSFIVFDTSTGEYLPSYLEVSRTTTPIGMGIYTGGIDDMSGVLTDGKSDTFIDFDMPTEGEGMAILNFKPNEALTSSAVSIILANNVSLPTFVEIRAIIDGVEKVIVARRPMTSQTVRFLETESTEWGVALWYAQPLRVTDVRLVESGLETSSSQTLRFLAQPDHSYSVYMDPDRSVSVAVGESGDLRSDKDVVTLSQLSVSKNLLYKEADTDEDGVPNHVDNCISVANTAQTDIDANGRGDVCDDFDKDGRINSLDNCVNQPNRGQEDEDGDGIGDVCDGQESRVTERNPWLPWAGLIFVAGIIIFLFTKTARGIREDNEASRNAESTTNSDDVPPQSL